MSKQNHRNRHAKKWDPTGNKRKYVRKRIKGEDVKRKIDKTTQRDDQ